MVKKANLMAGRLYEDTWEKYSFPTQTPTPKHIKIFGIDERVYFITMASLIAFLVLIIFYWYVIPYFKKRIKFRLTNQHIMVIIVGILIIISVVIYNQTRPSNCFSECLKDKTSWEGCHLICK